MRTRQPDPEQVHLWSRPNSRHSHRITLLVPLAKEIARKSGSHGCTVGDLRLAAVQRGLLSGHEKGRELSYLGAVMRAAGLVGTEHFRRSVIERSHGNLHRIFTESVR
jgi:hypothetical protein